MNNAFGLFHVFAAAICFALCDWLSNQQVGAERYKKLHYPVLWIAASVAFFNLCDVLCKIWGDGKDWSVPAYFGTLVSAGFAYYCFGRVTHQSGMAVGSSVINALNVITTILLGLFGLREWEGISGLQYLGMAFAVLGIYLMLFIQKKKKAEKLAEPVQEKKMEQVLQLWQWSARIGFWIVLPVGYVFFGYVLADKGLAIGSGVMNSTNLLLTILIGLFGMWEWALIRRLQYVGMFAALIGVVLMLFFGPPPPT